MPKQRIDLLLVEQGFFQSRSEAQRAIMAGLVRIGEERVDKPGTRVAVDAPLQVTMKPHPYVSRGGLKLEKALQTFSLSLDGRIMIDIGASTGGFTDCALQHGARKVYAVDVGYGQLDWKLRQDSRVIVMERTNFRHFRPQDLPGEAPDFATIDVSFISLHHILPPLKVILTNDGEAVALVKPQFEAGREQVGKKGVVRDPAIHQEVLLGFLSMAGKIGFKTVGLIFSPIMGGGDGNIEFLAHLRLGEPSESVGEEWQRKVGEVVKAAHQHFT